MSMTNLSRRHYLGLNSAAEPSRERGRFILERAEMLMYFPRDAARGFFFLYSQKNKISCFQRTYFAQFSDEVKHSPRMHFSPPTVNSNERLSYSEIYTRSFCNPATD